MNQTPRGTILCYLIIKAISAVGMALIAATYATFLISKGLNLLDVNLVNFVFYVTLFIFEIPTGAFADVFGRKLSFVISCSLFALGLFLYAAAHSFWMFAAAESVCAMGATFSSGAFQAWLVDSLRHQGYQGSLGKVFSREQQIRNGAGMLAAVAGAYAAEYNSSLPWFCGGCFFLVAGTIAVIFMKEENFVRQKFSFRAGWNSMKDVIVSSTRYSISNDAVRFIVIMSLAQFFCVQAANMQWQPFFMTFMDHKRNLGFIFSGISVAMMLGSLAAPTLLKWIRDEKKALWLTQTAIGIGIAATVYCHSILPALIAFIGHEVFRGMFVPIKDSYLNDNIPSRERATLLSFESISHHVGGMAGLLASGFMAQYLSMRFAWTFSGLTLIIAAFILMKAQKRKS